MRSLQRVKAVGGDEPNHVANHHFDSRRWLAIRLRKGDIIVNSWAKSGTTWLQQIVCQLVHDGAEHIQVNRISPWVDFRLTPLEEVVTQLEGQTFRRVMKSHLPADALRTQPLARYLYIARHPLDVVWSWHQHHLNFTDETYRDLNDTPGRVGPRLKHPDTNFRAYLHRWLKDDGYPFHPYWSNVGSWWELRRWRNVKLLHFADLSADFDATVQRLAWFLNIHLSAESLARVREHCSLEYMRDHAEEIVPFRGVIFKGGASSFIGSGAASQWAGVLEPDDIAACHAAAERTLSLECVKWLFRHEQ